MNIEPAMSRSLAFASVVLTGLLLIALSAAAVDTFTITAARAIVRAKPGITSPILTVAPHRAIFPVIETQEEWDKILLREWCEDVWHSVTMPELRPTGAPGAAVPIDNRAAVFVVVPGIWMRSAVDQPIEAATGRMWPPIVLASELLSRPS